MKQTFQGIPRNFPAPSLSVVTGGGDLNAAAGTYYFWLQGRNRQGYNELVNVASAFAAEGDRVDVTIPGTCRPANDGSDIQEVLILASTINDPATAVNLASVSGGTLPVTVSLSDDEHFAMGMGQLLAEEGDLPTSPVRGMRRQVDAWGEIREWDGASWVTSIRQEFSTYVASIDGEYGARQSLSLADFTEPVQYGITGSDSESVTYWLINNGTTTVAASTGIQCVVESADADISALINNGVLWMAFQGYVDADTAEADLTNAAETGNMGGIDAWVEYPGSFTGLILPKDLPPGQAYAISFRLNLSEETAKFAAYDGQTIGIRLDLEPYTATLVPMGIFTGSLISNDLQLRRIVPGGTGLALSALPGTGIVKISASQAYLFRERPEQAVSGLSTNTANQKIFISAQGNCFVADTSGATSTLRAVVGTVDGVGKAVTADASVSLSSSQSLQLIIGLPTAIRGDYPDVIAGTEATFNASSFRIYAKPNSGGNVLYWDVPIPLDQASVTLTLNTAGTDLGSATVPGAAEDFGLFAVDTPQASAVSGASSFATDTYTVSVSLIYANTTTSISHSVADGCIAEAEASLAELYEVRKYFREPVGTLSELAALDRLTLYDGMIISVLLDAGGETKPYVWDAKSSAAANGTTIIQLAAGGNGRFNMLGLGAGGAGGADIDATLNAIVTLGGEVMVDAVTGKVMREVVA